MAENDVELRAADEVACELLNLLATKGYQDFPTVVLIVAIMYGRLRYDAGLQGANIEEVDDLFQEHVNIFTNAMDT